MKTIIDRIAHMLVMKTLAPTLGEEKSIAIFALKNALHKIVLNRMAMPTMGVTATHMTTSSTTWSHMVMLKAMDIKTNRGVISAIILAMTNVEEENHHMSKMRGPSLGVANHLVKIFNNLVKIFNHILTVNQVKQVCTSNTNPMLWLAVEDLLFLLKPQEMKVPLLVEETWRMKRTCLEDSSSPCQRSRVKKMPRPTSHGHSRSTRYSASTTTPGQEGGYGVP